MLKQSLIESSGIKLHQEAKTWQEAIKIAIDVLVKSGNVKPSYYDAIIKAITDIGPYIILAPGLAMPHARPEDGVIKSGFSLITFDEPIYFDGEPEPVYMVIGFAGSDANAHMEGLVEITQVLDDPDSDTGVNIDKFLSCSTSEEILNLIDEATQNNM